MTIFLYLFVIACLILSPADTADTARDAMHIWGTSIVPMLFPYMVFSRLLCKSMHTLKLPAEPAAALLGLLGGSPSGAAVIAAHSSLLNPRNVYPLCALAGTISPMFILGSVQFWTGNPALCRSLLVCHWIASLLCALLIRVFCSKHAPRLSSAAPSNASSNAIAQSIDAILQVGGCVICYSVLASILKKLLPPHSLLQPCLHALLEISGGVHAITQSTSNAHAKHILLCGALGFGGLSILSQNCALLSPLGVSRRQLLCFSILRALISMLLMTLATCFSLN